MEGNSRKSFLAVSYSLPQSASGTPITVGRFLQNFTSEEVVLIGRPIRKGQLIKTDKPTYKTITIPTPAVGVRGERLWRLWSVVPGIIMGLYAIYRYKLNSILAFYRDEGSLLTGYLLHKITNLPFFPYFFDLYKENYQTGYQGILATWLQPRVFISATKVIVLSEGMREYFQKQYQIGAIVLPHCAARVPSNKYRDHKITTNTKLIKIGYLGGINLTRLYSLKLLTEVVNNYEGYEINYFTPTSKEIIVENGLVEGNVLVKYLPVHNELMRELAMCDILFLPASRDMESRSLELQMRTGFPTKILDYINCQKPILVHGQPDFFVSSFFKKHKCGHIVDGGVKEILAGLERLRFDFIYGEELVANAEIALNYFEGGKIANNFRNILSLS